MLLTGEQIVSIPLSFYGTRLLSIGVTNKWKNNKQISADTNDRQGKTLVTFRVRILVCATIRVNIESGYKKSSAAEIVWDLT